MSSKPELRPSARAAPDSMRCQIPASRPSVWLSAGRFLHGEFEESVQLLSEELEAHVESFGHNCINYLPTETKHWAAKVGEVHHIMLQIGHLERALEAFWSACLKAWR